MYKNIYKCYESILGILCFYVPWQVWKRNVWIENWNIYDETDCFDKKSHILLYLVY